MLIIWLATVIGNVILSLLLIWRQHYIRYGWLTFSSALAVFMDGWFWYCRTYHHSAYTPSRNLIFFLWLFLNGMVIAESWREGRIRVPVEIQTAGEIALLLAKKAQFVWAVYFIDCALRGVNLVILGWLLVLFLKKPEYLRKGA